MTERCEFDLAWIGRCKGKADEYGVCAKHQKYKCWCGAQATRECSIASSFVCGFTTCDEHECRNVAYGMTGSYGNKHSEKGYRQHEEWKAARKP